MVSFSPQSHDFFTKTKDKQLYDGGALQFASFAVGWCWPGTSSYPDFCNPDARKLWTSFFRMDYYPHNRWASRNGLDKSVRKDLYTWNDMNESL